MNVVIDQATPSQPKKGEMGSEENSECPLARDVWCLLGVPLDNLDLRSAEELVRQRRTSGGSAQVLSTVNVNWLVKASRDPDFCRAIINSDVVSIDGKPVLWLVRLLGYPMHEVVPGSTLIQNLQNQAKGIRPLTIFLFGGEKGVAERAAAAMNRRRGGLRAVGALFPGFASVEQLSDQRFIDEINQARPDILLVALGAEKGVAWIERNRSKLRVGVVSHLGATINFLAGNVARAPVIMQKMGVEWLWRIACEPRLAGRYFSDGLALVKIVSVRMPALVIYWWGKRQSLKSGSEDEISATTDGDTISVACGRYVTNRSVGILTDLLRSAVQQQKDLIVDWRKTVWVDASIMGKIRIGERELAKKQKSLTMRACRFPLSWVMTLYAARRGDTGGSGAGVS